MGTDPEQSADAAARLRAAGWTGAEPARGDLTGRETEIGPSRGYLWEPAEFLAEVASLLPRSGRALDLACGSGRNAVYLALGPAAPTRPDTGARTNDGCGGSTGIRMVMGVDVLPDAIAQARRLRRVTPGATGRVRFRIADLTDPGVASSILRPGVFRLISCFRYLDRAILPLIGAALAPGGMVVYETFLVAQRIAHGRPSNPAYLLEPGELRAAFAELEIVRYREGRDPAGNHLASLLARRPEPV